MNIDLSQISIDLFNLSRSRDINLKAAITDFDGKTFFYGNSPINQQNSLTESCDAKKIEIDCFKLNSVLQKYKIEKIDYLNIDVEGSEFQVISTFDFIQFNPTLVSIEFNDYDFDNLLNSNIYNLMKDNGYKFVAKFELLVYTKADNVKKISDLMSI